MGETGLWLDLTGDGRGLCEYVAHRRVEAQVPITHRQHQSAHRTPLEILQQGNPRLSGFLIAFKSAT